MSDPSQPYTPHNKLNAIDAKEEIIQWGEAEFGLSNQEKEVLDEIYSELGNNADNDEIIQS